MPVTSGRMSCAEGSASFRRVTAAPHRNSYRRSALTGQAASISSSASGDWFAIIRAFFVPHLCFLPYLFSRFTAIRVTVARFSAAWSVRAVQ